jgi:RHS repeat-associated protein
VNDALVVNVLAGGQGIAACHLYREKGQEDAITAAGQLRLSLGNNIDSVMLELDGNGAIVSREEYFPFGGTAVLAGDSAELKYKYIRYSGKERDGSGLYYFGRRYYMPWLGRWASSDPAGTVDGCNLYRMVRNNPVCYRDSNGLWPAGMPLLTPKTEWYFMDQYKQDLTDAGLMETEQHQLNSNNPDLNIPMRGGEKTYQQLIEEGLQIGGNIHSLFSFGGRDGGFELTMALRDETYRAAGWPHGAFTADANVETFYLDAQSAETHSATEFNPAYKEAEALDVNLMANPFWDVIYKKGVFSAKTMVFLITDKWLASPYCRKEYQWFLEAQAAGKSVKGLFVIFPDTDKSHVDALKIPHGSIVFHNNDMPKESLAGVTPISFAGGSSNLGRHLSKGDTKFITKFILRDERMH